MSRKCCIQDGNDPCSSWSSSCGEKGKCQDDTDFNAIYCCSREAEQVKDVNGNVTGYKCKPKSTPPNPTPTPNNPAGNSKTVLYWVLSVLIFLWVMSLGVFIYSKYSQ
jgi:hypothetical protein